MLKTRTTPYCFLKIFLFLLAVLLSITSYACKRNNDASTNHQTLPSSDGMDLETLIFAEAEHIELYNHDFLLVLSLIKDKKFVDTQKEAVKGRTFWKYLPNNEAKSSKRGSHVYALVYLMNPGVDSRGMSNVTANFSLKGPHGHTITTLNEVDIWSEREPPPQNWYQPAIQNFPVFVAEADPPGDYVVEALVTDHVRNATIELKRSISFN